MASVPVVVDQDARKHLEVLKQEWAGCSRCDLSVHRDAVGGNIVFGEGGQRGILFLGEGPGVQEERAGRPFVGKSGELLRRFIEHYNIQRYYITNVVACRSCAPLLDAEGLPIFSQGWGKGPPQQRFKDQPPNNPQVHACAARVYEEIYLADPVVIVALGQPAAAFLKGQNVQITKLRGAPMEITIPGAGHRAVLSAKKQEWARKVKGAMVMPTEQSRVRYLMIPTLHPSYVLRQQHNTNPDNPFESLAKDIRLAKTLYNRFYEEITGTVPEAYDESDDIPYELLDREDDEHGD